MEVNTRVLISLAIVCSRATVRAAIKSGSYGPLRRLSTDVSAVWKQILMVFGRVLSLRSLTALHATSNYTRGTTNYVNFLIPTM